MTAGKDADRNKPTYVSLLGLQGARDRAQSLHQRAQAALRRANLPDGRYLAALADRIVERES